MEATRMRCLHTCMRQGSARHTLAWPPPGNAAPAERHNRTAHTSPKRAPCPQSAAAAGAGRACRGLRGVRACAARGAHGWVCAVCGVRGGCAVHVGWHALQSRRLWHKHGKAGTNTSRLCVCMERGCPPPHARTCHQDSLAWHRVEGHLRGRGRAKAARVRACVRKALQRTGGGRCRQSSVGRDAVAQTTSRQASQHAARPYSACS
jgi:hypothetical protein